MCKTCVPNPLFVYFNSRTRTSNSCTLIFKINYIFKIILFDLFCIHVQLPYSIIGILFITHNFTFVIHWSLSPAVSIVSWCRSHFVCSGPSYEIYSGCDPSTYVYCMVRYHLITASYVGNIVVSLHTVTMLMTMWSAHWTMSFLYSLNVFLTILQHGFRIRYSCETQLIVTLQHRVDSIKDQGKLQQITGINLPQCRDKRTLSTKLASQT